MSVIFLSVVKLDDSGKGVVPTRTIRLNHPHEIACLKSGVRLSVIFSEGTNSRSQRDQIALAYDCARTYLFLWLKCSPGKSEGKLVACCPSKKWFQVNVSNSRESVLTGVIGLEFKVCSTRQNVVPNTSSVTQLLPSM